MFDPHIGPPPNDGLASLAAARPLPRGGRPPAPLSPLMTLQRTTIPIALAMAACLPLLGFGWFLLPGDAPLKVGSAALAVGAIALGLIFAVAAAGMMWQVARRTSPAHRSRGPAARR